MSSEVVGSSSRSSGASWVRARQRTARCCSPPLSVWSRRWASLPEVEPREGSPGGEEVARAFAAERPEMSGPAEQDVLVDPHPGRQQRRLRDEREAAGDLAAGERADLLAVE